jgi:hypothetical protein
MVPYNELRHTKFVFAKRQQTVALDIHIQFGELVYAIRVSVPRRAKEGGGV